eukprot:TRINITY_DN15505_c1_g1_i2.p1 TRINITY_DN15505_c1_g1~~TRINITY_DN15505_c1_g1_i2.p1  ORF type:complete len:348 (-),score=55.52 TRINITY_DN15505_c1_g1_i2:40-1083(-)
MEATLSQSRSQSDLERVSEARQEAEASTQADDGIRDLPGSFNLARFSDFDVNSIVVEPVEPVDSLYEKYGGRCLVLRNALTEEECQYLIQELSNGGDMEQVLYREDYRRNDRCIFGSSELSDILWKRVEPFTRDLSLRIDAEDPTQQYRLDPSRLDEIPASKCPEELQVGYGSEGVWQPTKLNDRLRFCRYNPGGFFRAHCDAPYKKSEEEQSFFTCMFYLDGGFQGGATRFLKIDSSLTQENYLKPASENQVLATVNPEAGQCILFFQPGLLHEGTDLIKGVKHILRTEVMFQRDPSTKAVRTAAQIEALALVKKAQELEASSQCDEAWPLYRRAFKLDPKLERMY